jgi:hypothetical protein
VPRQLAATFPADFEVQTVQQMGWAGTKNGQLLRLPFEHKFAALITADKNMEYQQNHTGIQTMVIVLVAHGNRLQELQPLVPEILNVLNHNSSAGIYRIGV